jgi:hypothetical protein
MTDHSCPTGTALSLTVSCVPENDEALQLKARALAEKLTVGQGVTASDPPQFLLVYTAKGLELQTMTPQQDDLQQP